MKKKKGIGFDARMYVPRRVKNVITATISYFLVGCSHGNVREKSIR